MLGFGLSGDSSAVYRPESLLFRVLGTLDTEDDESTELTIEVAGETSLLDETLAVFEAVQIAFGAAVAAVDYIEAYGDLYQDGRRTPETLVRARLQELTAIPTSKLEILFIEETGSFKGIVKAVTGRKGRRRIIAVAGVAAGIVSIFFLPAGAIAAAVVLAVGTVSAEVDDWIEDKAKKHLESRVNDLEGEFRKFREDLDQRDAVIAELMSEKLRLVNEDKLNKARIQELTFKLEGPNVAAAA